MLPPSSLAERCSSHPPCQNKLCRATPTTNTAPCQLLHADRPLIPSNYRSTPGRQEAEFRVDSDRVDSPNGADWGMLRQAPHKTYPGTAPSQCSPKPAMRICEWSTKGQEQETISGDGNIEINRGLDCANARGEVTEVRGRKVGVCS